MGKPLTLELLNIWTGGWPLPVVKRNFGCRTFSTFSSLPVASYPPTIPQASQTFLYFSNFSSSSFSSSCLPPATTPPLFLLFTIPKSALIPITQKSFHPLSLVPFSCSFVCWLLVPAGLSCHPIARELHHLFSSWKWHTPSYPPATEPFSL